MPSFLSRANNASTPFTLVRISQSYLLMLRRAASSALKLRGGFISMVGISTTSAPISRNGLASPPDCLLARVVRMRHPLSGSSFFGLMAALLGLMAALLGLMAVSAPQLPAHKRR